MDSDEGTWIFLMGLRSFRLLIMFVECGSLNLWLQRKGWKNKVYVPTFFCGWYCKFKIRFNSNM